MIRDGLARPIPAIILERLLLCYLQREVLFPAGDKRQVILMIESSRTAALLFRSFFTVCFTIYAPVF
jgi:hypothetical protein